jgi:hypothetical protein
LKFKLIFHAQRIDSALKSGKLSLWGFNQTKRCLKREKILKIISEIDIKIFFFLGDPIEISSLKKIYNVVNFEYSSEALDQKVKKCELAIAHFLVDII